MNCPLKLVILNLTCVMVAKCSKGQNPTKLKQDGMSEILKYEIKYALAETKWHEQQAFAGVAYHEKENI